MSTYCQQDDRRDAVRRTKQLNGLDYVEVSNDQLTLTAFFLGKLPPELSVNRPDLGRFLRVEGGQRVTDIRITDVEPVVDPDPERDDQLVITLDQFGDFSTYTLKLVGVENIDPGYDEAQFSFKVNCPSDLDCAPTRKCDPPALDEPEINYLAKDYASFRQLILDRLALLVPDWRERHVPDVGIALVELLAYTGDHLSYFQDAVATEAYIETARQRISVRRHARLVDYKMHEGCNARTWICLQTTADFALDLSDVAFTTDFDDPSLPPETVLNWLDLRGVPVDSYKVFEPVQADGAAPIQLYIAHSEIQFYTWGKKECCLVRGSTSATLLDNWVKSTPPPPSEPPQAKGKAKAEAAHASRPRQLHLQPGDVLIFEEVIGPITGNPADADPARRHAVRLTKVTPGEDKLFRQPIVEIEWAPADALPFPFCISAIGGAPECKYFEGISVARGNAILVDHGRTLDPENLGEVPVLRSDAECECADHPGDVEVTPGPFRPTLSKTPLTFRESLPKEDAAKSTWAPASALLKQDVRCAQPQVRLASLPAKTWSTRYDLLGSEPGDWAFVVEMDNDGVAHLRFGDGELGSQPPAEMSFIATYRVGNGASGNVGADTISRLVLDKTKLSGVTLVVRNPLPARGGTEAEPMAEAKLLAPHAFRNPKQIQRAIIADDYKLVAERNSKVQRAAASLVWTGSWFEADVAIDPFGNESADDALFRELTKYLRRFRRLGHDLHVKAARYVPLDLKLEVCVLPHYQRAHVKAALLDIFSARTLPGGQRGFFHPDQLTFGEGIFLSKIIATAQAVTGVDWVKVSRFQRLFDSPNFEIENGVLSLRAGEIAQLDNDPNFPEHGKIEIQVNGGR